MKHFKNQDGSIYGFEADGSQDELIAADMVALTAEETELLLNPPVPEPVVPTPAEAALAEIERLEKKELLPRAVREFMILSMRAQFTPEQLALSKGYVAVAAFDSQIAALRKIL
jgi:hypothetical protein